MGGSGIRLAWGAALLSAAWLFPLSCSGVSSNRDVSEQLPPRFIRYRHFGEHAWSLAFSPDGKYLAAGGTGQPNVILWDVHAEKAKASYGVEGAEGINHLSFSPDSKLLAASDKERDLNLWDTCTGKKVTIPKELSNHSSAEATFLPKGKVLAIRRYSKHGLQLWQYPEFKKVSEARFAPDNFKFYKFSSDGSFAIFYRGDKEIRLWDLHLGSTTRTIAHTHWHADDLTVHPDGNLIAWTDDGEIMLWDIAQQRTVRTLIHEDGWRLSLAFSPNGKLLASGSAGHWNQARNVKLWDVATGRELQTLPWDGGMVWSIAFHPEGKILAVGGEGGVDLWTLSLAGKEAFD